MTKVATAPFRRLHVLEYLFYRSSVREWGQGMRWDNLRIIGDADAAVPLIERTAVTRTFDTPEFKGMTFYEIHAKSIINKVPAASRVPFGWTINPYRGCGHACVLLLCPQDARIP